MFWVLSFFPLECWVLANAKLLTDYLTSTEAQFGGFIQKGVFGSAFTQNDIAISSGR